MKTMILAVTASFGLAALVGGAGSALAGGNAPQEHWTWQYEEAVGTGTLPASDAAKMERETVSPGPRAFSDTQEHWAWQHEEAIETGALLVTSDTPDFDADPRWRESGGE